jgi:uncharacterized membrane protein YecN with MAPEG domain
MNPFALYCVAALGLLLFSLGPVISALRGRAGQFIGNETDPSNTLHKWVRAHGNTAEYAPFLAILILWLGAHNPASWLVWTMIAATAARYLHAAGMVLPSTMNKPNVLRFASATGTYVTGPILCAALFLG